MKPKLALVVSEFNGAVTADMRLRAEDRARALGYDPTPVAQVAGSWDLPFVVDLALTREDVAGAVAIGVIVTGETKHDEAIGHATVKTLQEISLLHGKPVGLAVTGPGQTYAQAAARVDRAEAAVEAVHMSLEAARALAPKPQPAKKPAAKRPARRAARRKA